VNAVQSVLLLAIAAGIAGCDKLPFPDPNRAALQRELDAKAIGGACRHAGRALEDCYSMNKRASKAAIFAGWREMNDYMTQNKIDVVLPGLPGGSSTAQVNADGEETRGASPAPATDGAHAEHTGSKNPAMTES
jgi:hypothetical protein